MASPSGMSIRGWRSGDELVVDSLLADDAGEIWRTQFHTLHGPDRAHPFRRTLVAEDDDMLGVVTVAASPIHTTGAACAIEIHPHHRRRGIGSALLDAVRSSLPGHFPLRAKVSPRDTQTMAFLRAAGAREYQRALGEEVDLGPAALAWARATLAPSRVTLLPLTAFKDHEVLAAFVELYAWIHASWNPVGSGDALHAALANEMEALDRELSVAAVDADGIVALVLVFPEGNGVLEVVAETVRGEQPNGKSIVAAAIARLCEVAVQAGWTTLAFDGHPTDPHLAHVLATMPVARTSPLLLMEILG